ncbi:carbonic anhydrase [Maricaulis sp. CAU 1757]
MPAQPPRTLLDGYRRFRTEGYAAQRSLYAELAKGQAPHTLVIACCDSRVDPAQIFAANPGDLFVVRNVANIVPPFVADGSHHGVSAALEFAVKKLEVPNILVLGHRQCGGVQACVSGERDPESLFIDRWIEPLEAALSDARSGLPENADPETVAEKVELCSIRRSIERLLNYPFVAARAESGDLRLDGARFGIADGVLEWLGEDGDFRSVPLADAAAGA